MAIKTFGIVGAGTMGTGIAQTAALCGLKAILLDVNEDILRQAMQRFGKSIQRLIDAGKLDQPARDAALASVQTATDYAALSAADAVIEAATEREGLKTEILKRIDAVVRPDTIIATNT